MEYGKFSGDRIFFVLDCKYRFRQIWLKKIKIVSRLKFGAQVHLNMENLMVMFIFILFFRFKLELPFQAILVEKIKIVSPS